MRSFWTTRTAWLVVALTLGSSPAQAQFTPGGRRKPTAPAPARPAPSKPSKPSTTAPASTPPAATPAAAPAAPSVDASIERYQRLLLEQPGEHVPFERLRELRLARDGSLEPWLAEMTALANGTGPRSYEARLVQAALLVRLGRPAEATTAFRQATTAKPQRPEAWRENARWLAGRGQKSEARAELMQALPLVRGGERDEMLRELRTLSLELGELDKATGYQKLLMAGGQGRVFLAAELGRDLLARGQTGPALLEYRRVVAQFQGHPSALGSLLLELGRAEIAAGEVQAAEATLERASTEAQSQPGLANEIDQARADLARRQGTLAAFTEQLSRGPQSTSRLRLLGQLQEEQGDARAALAAYEKALSREPRDLDTRLHLIRLLEQLGRLEEAERQYAALVRSSPRDASLSLRYMDALLARGQRSRALVEFERIEAQTQRAEETLTLIDYAERIEEPARATRLLGRLDQAALNEPRQLIELGARHYRDGRVEQAREIWGRVQSLARSKPTAERAQLLVLYGEVLIDHEGHTPGLEALTQAAELVPADSRVQRSLALGLERVATQRAEGERDLLNARALLVWQRVLAAPATPESEAQRDEARRHVVRIWQRNERLGQELPPLARRLAQLPPDIEAGRLLVEGELRQGRRGEAERALNAILAQLPDDRSSLEALALLHEQTGRTHLALSTWERLVRADPARARSHLTHLAVLATQLHLDERALGYAEQRVALSPGDASAQAELGRLELRLGHPQRAQAAFLQALRLDPAQQTVSLALAELYVRAGKRQEAYQLLLALVEQGAEEELLRQAVTQALAIQTENAEPAASLEALDQLLLRLSLEHPTQPVYRSLLLAVYEAEQVAFQSRSQGPGSSASQSALVRLGKRSLTPLLAILATDRVEEHGRALRLLQLAPARESARSLVAYAQGATAEHLRVQALSALEGSSDRAVTELVAPLVRGEPRWGARVAQAAARVLALSAEDTSRVELGRAVESRDAVVQAYALLGLSGALPGSRPPRCDDALRTRIASRLADDALPPATRAAAALAWGACGGRTSTLEAYVDDSEPAVAQAALRAWVRKTGLAGQKDQPLRNALARALLAPQLDVRLAAAGSASLLFARADEPPTLPSPDEWRANESLTPEALLLVALRSPDAPSASLRALVALEPELLEATRGALSGRNPTARAVLVLLGAEEGRPGLSPLSDALTRAPHAEREQPARAALQDLHKALAPDFLRLAGSSDPGTAALAVALLRPEGDEFEARTLLVLERALEGAAELPRESAMTVLAQSPSPAATRLLTELAQQSDSWSVRRRVAVALGVTLQHSSQAECRALAADGLRTLLRDPSALVVQSAEKALTP